VFTGPNGKPIESGAQGQIVGGEQFFVGYDGRAFVKNLKAQNAATIQLGGGQCQANFDYTPKRDQQVIIGPVACR
jgi:outer membrane usher protein